MFLDLDKEIQKLDNLQSKMSDKKRMLDEVQLTTPELIEAQGYPAEIHNVVTEDGYILEMHRIPHGINNTTPILGPRPVVYLQHCLFCSSSDWIMNTPDRALAYILADAGYDVWLGNARGNTYSKKHRLLQPTSDLFWQFSWAEMGKYDAPAMIDHVLNTTQQQQLYYVGFSMGTTVFFTMMDYHPEYNDKIRGMVALAPVAYDTQIKGPLGAMMPFASYFEILFSMAGVNEILPSGEMFDTIVASLCSNENRLTAAFCKNILFALTGPNLDQLNPDYLPVILSHTPAGTSARTLLHFLQNGRADKFQDFDHGFFGNFRLYGQATPPAYKLSKVTAPVACFYSENDWLAPPVDVQRTLSEIPNVILKFRVDNKNFSHLDFVWARDAVSLVYQPLLKVLERF